MRGGATAENLPSVDDSLSPIYIVGRSTMVTAIQPIDGD
jgi:hypothetical protein